MKMKLAQCDAKNVATTFANSRVMFVFFFLLCSTLKWQLHTKSRVGREWRAMKISRHNGSTYGSSLAITAAIKLKIFCCHRRFPTPHFIWGKPLAVSLPFPSRLEKPLLVIMQNYNVNAIFTMLPISPFCPSPSVFLLSVCVFNISLVSDLL